MVCLIIVFLLFGALFAVMSLGFVILIDPIICILVLIGIFKGMKWIFSRFKKKK